MMTSAVEPMPIPPNGSERTMKSVVAELIVKVNELVQRENERAFWERPPK